MLTPEQRERRMEEVRRVEQNKRKRLVSADNPPHRVIKTKWNYMDRSARSRVYSWIQMRATEPGIKTAEMARRLGITPGTLNSVIYKARKEGWLVFDDPMSKLEHDIIPQTVDNLKKFVDAGDKTVTIEVAKGTIFKQFQEAKGISDAPVTVLALKIEAPEAGGEVKVMTGQIVGRPRSLED